VTAGPISLTLDTRAGAVSPGAFGPSPVAVRIGSTDAQGPVRSLSGTFNGRLGFDGSRLTIHDLRLEAPEGRLSLAGWLDVISESTGVEMRGRLETDLARAGPLVLPPGDPLTGSATADVVVRGAMANPTVRLEVTGRNLRFRSTPVIGLEASASYAAGRADIDRLAVTSDVGEIEATATLHVTTEGGKPGESRLAARITRLDLDRALRAAGLSLPVAIGSTAGGNINLSLDAGTPVNLDSWRYVRGDGSIDLTPEGSGLSLSGRVDLATRDRR
jgi:autotransporter translocation and assembly factor TamB